MMNTTSLKRPYFGKTKPKRLLIQVLLTEPLQSWLSFRPSMVVWLAVDQVEPIISYANLSLNQANDSVPAFHSILSPGIRTRVEETSQALNLETESTWAKWLQLKIIVCHRTVLPSVPKYLIPWIETRDISSQNSRWGSRGSWYLSTVHLQSQLTCLHHLCLLCGSMPPACCYLFAHFSPSPSSSIPPTFPFFLLLIAESVHIYGHPNLENF